MPPGRPEVITLATEFFMDRSANGGKTWKTVIDDGGGTSWSSLSYVSQNVGWVVDDPIFTAYNALLRTSDAGATWHKVRF